MNKIESTVAQFVEANEEFCKSFVIPLLIPSTKSLKSAPEFVGTGFIIKYLSNEYLVSANHVIEVFEKHSSAIYSLSPASNSFFEIKQKNSGFCSSGDIAVMKVTSVIPNGLTPLTYKPERLNEATDNLLHVWGYPGSKNKNILSKGKSVPMGMTLKITEESIDLSGNSTARNAVLQRDNFVENGTSPHPDGMSGSPVFSLGAERVFTQTNRISEREFTLVGVYTETHNKEKLCQYELLSHALYACREEYPDFENWQNFQLTNVY